MKLAVLRREMHPNWKGGIIINDAGYVLIKMPEHPRANKNGYVRQHIVVAEGMLGRPLRPNEIVHHKNGIKNDNRPENLEIYPTRSKHTVMHLKNRSELDLWLHQGTMVRKGGIRCLKNGQVCPRCGSNFAPKDW